MYQKQIHNWINFKVSAVGICLAMVLLISGCKTVGPSDTQDSPLGPSLKDSRLGEQIGRAPAGQADDVDVPDTNGPDFIRAPSQLSRIPEISERADQGERLGGGPSPKPQTETVDAFVSPLVLPQFIDVVYGEMLGIPYVTGPEVANMDDVVQLRSSGEMNSTDFMELVSEALETYGVRVFPNNGTLQITRDEALRSRIPRFIKSRARLRTRGDLRPVIQFVEMQAVDANSMLGFLRQAFTGQTDSLKITANPGKNFISLAGLPEDVDAAINIIRELDELDFAGTDIQRYTPQYWNVEEFSQALEQALQVEGWAVTSNFNLTRTIFLMPVDYSNDLFIFSKTQTAHERAQSWIRELDKPVQGGDTEQIYIYQVKNVDAAVLSETANSVLLSSQNGRGRLGAGSTQFGNSTPNNANSDESDSRRGSISNGVFSVDPVGNRIIFTGTSTEYSKFVNLLEQLDTPAPEVLIEVQIAEVTLSDSTNFGMEFFIDDIGDSNFSATAATQALGTGTSGLNLTFLSGNVDAAINAFASNRRVKLLSTPILVARSGSESEIQVGQDVPIITAQRAANNQNGQGDTDILQSIAYRKVGNLLSISPIVFSDNRIDLSITQEVSSTVDVSNSTISSPTISNRSLSTQLSLEDGQTAVLGGLISENYVTDEKGVPIIKDLPIVGNLFSNDTFSVDRTELVLLITAYVLRGQPDKERFVNRLTNRVDGFLRDESRMMTLLPNKP